MIADSSFDKILEPVSALFTYLIILRTSAKATVGLLYTKNPLRQQILSKFFKIEVKPSRKSWITAYLDVMQKEFINSSTFFVISSVGNMLDSIRGVLSPFSIDSSLNFNSPSASESPCKHCLS